MADEAAIARELARLQAVKANDANAVPDFVPPGVGFTNGRIFGFVKKLPWWTEMRGSVLNA